MRACKAYLFDHLVMEHTVPVDDFYGDRITCLLVLGELDLGEAAFSQSPPQLVFPDPGPSTRHWVAHSLLLQKKIQNLNATETIKILKEED